MLSENNLLSNIKDIENYMPINSSDNMLISRPIYHCAVMTSELLYGLIKDSKILFSVQNLNPIRMNALIEENHITVTSATPTIFYYLSRYINKTNSSCGLKAIAISGECMTEAVANEITKAMPDTKKFNVYGLTEASPRVTYLPYELFEKYPTSVGIPLKSVKIKTVNDELLVKSPGVMQGYFGNDALTSKVIKNDWLYTGDIAEIRNGLLYIKCRKDDMIIRAGMNIYPQEIENALRADRHVTDVMVYGIKDDIVGERIIAEVISEDLNANDIFAICKRKLPSYQYPDKILIKTEFERTVSGKIMRKQR